MKALLKQLALLGLLALASAGKPKGKKPYFVSFSVKRMKNVAKWALLSRTTDVLLTRQQRQKFQLWIED